MQTSTNTEQTNKAQYRSSLLFQLKKQNHSELHDETAVHGPKIRDNVHELKHVPVGYRKIFSTVRTVDH